MVRRSTKQTKLKKNKILTMTSQAVCQHSKLEQEVCETLLQKHREIISLRHQKKLLDECTVS